LTFFPTPPSQQKRDVGVGKKEIAIKVKKQKYKKIWNE
jgi:hypothetical protein